MTRPLIYDVTHLASRLLTARSSGIDKVDLAYAEHFANGRCDGLLHYGLFAPRCHHPRHFQSLLSGSAATAVDKGMGIIYQWLTSGVRPPHSRTARKSWPSVNEYRSHLGWAAGLSMRRVPEHSLYLNIGQHRFEHPRYFSWLQRRTDVRPVFFVHDLLPLDWPEYFRPSYRDRFSRRWATIRDFGKALIVSTHDVRLRIERQLKNEGRPIPPIHVAPLPSPLSSYANLADPSLQQVPYFVMLGTIEPRKNHLLILNIWRRLAEVGGLVPKLVIVGARGWENEQVLDVLDRGALVKPHVLEISGVGTRALARTVANARALLIPSFAEGYGLPVVEAMSLGTPVIASDIPVFREVTQGLALYRHPLDGLGWRQLIEQMSGEATTNDQRAAQAAFRKPNWADYFTSLDGFLDKLE